MIVNKVKLEEIRTKIIDSILFIILYLVPLGILAMLVRASITGWLWSNSLNLIFASLLFITGVFRKKLPTTIKSYIFISVLICVGTNVFIQNGLLSFGPIYFLTAIGLSMILVDKIERISIMAVVLTLTFSIGLFINYFNITPDYNIEEYMTSTKAWLTTIVNISILASILYFAFREYNNALSQSLEDIAIAQKQLIEQSKNAAVGKMIANIAHQWRQPINNISLIAQHLEFSYRYTKGDKDAIINKGLKDILDTANYMSLTIESFRELLRPASLSESFKIVDSLNDSFKIIERSIEVSNIHFTKNIKIDNIYLQGMKNRFMQIILNLLNNAIDVLNEVDSSDKKIDISASILENEILQIIVKDNGSGILAEEYSMIFEPFYSTKKDNLGTGLGLHIAKDILENDFQGKIKAINNDEKGASFLIEIPLKLNC